MDLVDRVDRAARAKVGPDSAEEWTAGHGPGEDVGRPSPPKTQTARPVLAPDWERARLDVSFMDADGRLTHVDVSFASAGTIQVDELRLRGNPSKPGRAAALRAAEKRRRYKPADNPTEPLVVFAVESRGRLGEEALLFLRAMAPADATRGAELSRAYRELSVLTQRRRAHLLRAAEGGRFGLEARGARSAGRR